MGKFSSYIDKIQKQTELLRNSLTDSSGIDCSKLSIGACSEVIKQLNINNEDIPIIEDKYIRPEWYPDVKYILNNAPIITKNSITYYPLYIVLLDGNSTPTSVFYKKYIYASSPTSDLNWNICTGGDGVVCSDLCNNKLENISEETLLLGDITYSWDKNKDIVGGDNTSVKWFIVYAKSKSVSIAFNFDGPGFIECVLGDMTLDTSPAPGIQRGAKGSGCLKYLEMQPSTILKTNITIDLENVITAKLNATLQSNKSYYISCRHCYNLSYLELPEKQTSLGQYAFSGCTSNNFIDFSKYKLTDFSGFEGATHIPNLYNLNITSLTNFANTSTIEEFVAPNSLLSISSSFKNCKALKTVVLPTSLFTLGVDCFIGATSLETLIIPDSVQTINEGLCRSCSNLKTLILPETVTSLNLNGFCEYCTSLKYIKFPKTATILNPNSSNIMPSVTYCELYDNFDVSGINFTGRTDKSIQWLKSLCLWLRDRTGLTPNTMILGPINITSLQNIHLTFTNKKDISFMNEQTQETITALQFITEQLNWTLS